MIVSLDEAKGFLRVDVTDDDVMIQTLITAAETYLNKATGTMFDSTNSLAHTVCLMLIAQWYSNRENAGQLGNPQGSVLNGLIAQLSMAYDVSPVQSPMGLNGTVDEGVAWLRWLPNTEPNIDGYNVYRDGVKINTDLVRRRRINSGDEFYEYWVWSEFVPVPPKTPPGVIGFRDSTATSGLHSYQVTAVDTLGNESMKSAAAQVTL